MAAVVQLPQLLAAAVILSIASAISHHEHLAVDREELAQTFDGIGALSGGGATSVLLPYYPEESRSQILDYLFKPNFGASLQILKVEIGGDSQSTDGTEPSHMHNPDKIDLHTGYEWWLMQEAKKRNPDIKLYGLAWSFPGWVGNQTGGPFNFPELTTRYLVEWVRGARTEYDLEIDYLGIWNERGSDSAFVQMLRKGLDAAGFRRTKIVAKDNFGLQACKALAEDPAFAAAVDVVGVHYISDEHDFSKCHSLGKPVWASEESSSFDDLNGAACWGNIVSSHWIRSGITADIMWNLVGAYYHGLNWYASSMMTASEPWSGHYDVSPVIWATAHVSQFTRVGWRYLAKGAGSGELRWGGFYTTWVDSEADDFTISVVKISRGHASCTRPKLPIFDAKSENVTFMLLPSMRAPAVLQLWYSNFETFEGEAPLFQHSEVQVVDGRVTLEVPIGAMYTLTTLRTGKKGFFDPPPTASPAFPLPYHNDFQELTPSKDAPLLADQIGSFEVHTSSDGRKSLVQMVPDLPIGWADHGSNGPMTLLGMREWQDIRIEVAFKLPPPWLKEPQDAQLEHGPDMACVAARVDQMWHNGVVFCISPQGRWSLTNAGPRLQRHGGHNISATHELLASGRAATAVGSDWHNLSLVVQPGHNGADVARGVLDTERLFKTEVRALDTGFAAIGCNGWSPVEFRDLSVSRAGSGWRPTKACGLRAAPLPGSVLSALPCARNGHVDESQAWHLLPSFQLQHVATGLCAHAGHSGLLRHSTVMLARCASGDAGQIFRHDYTHIRNTRVHMEVSGMRLLGWKSGRISANWRGGDWQKWSYFPNTKQLRNQYTADLQLGYPLCLSVCAAASDSD